MIWVPGKCGHFFPYKFWIASAAWFICGGKGIRKRWIEWALVNCGNLAEPGGSCHAEHIVQVFWWCRCLFKLHNFAVCFSCQIEWGPSFMRLSIWKTLDAWIFSEGWFEEFSQVTSAEFMEQCADVEKTKTKDGYNPLLEDYSNTKFYISFPEW